MLDNLLQYITVLNMENQIIIKTPIYLTDTEYFCNKSWTISFNLNTNSWVSFHSYIPNFYVGENNFFYSGINGCCSDIDGEFTALVGDLNRIVPTTTTTSTSSSTTTSTTTIAIDCDLEGNIIVTHCELVGTATISGYPPTTTTLCQRPFDLSKFRFFTGYEIIPNPPVISTDSLEDACAAIASTKLLVPYVIMNSITVNAVSLSIGEIVYLGASSTDCTFVPDGWYFTDEGLFNGFVYKVSGGVIVEKTGCPCGTTTSTTTLAPSIQECCGIIFNKDENIYYSNLMDSNVNTLSIPGFISSLGTALSNDKFWTINTKITEWDITLSPFTAEFNKDVTFLGGFTTTSGITYKSPNILIGTNTTPTPRKVVEIDVSGVTTSITNKFDLQADREPHGNPLYTASNKLIIINHDTVSGDYFLTQYNYLSGALELDLNTGSTPLLTLFECNCNIYVVDENDGVYIIDRNSPYELNPVLPISTSITNSTQLNSCVTSSITENNNITTTTTTTYFPNTFCYTVTIEGDCIMTWIDYEGNTQEQQLFNETVNVCAKQYSINFSCSTPGPITITGGISPCVTNDDC